MAKRQQSDEDWARQQQAQVLVVARAEARTKVATDTMAYLMKTKPEKPQYDEIIRRQDEALKKIDTSDEPFRIAEEYRKSLSGSPSKDR